LALQVVPVGVQFVEGAHLHLPVGIKKGLFSISLHVFSMKWKWGVYVTIQTRVDAQ
jgi:hypothetical protein